MADLYTTTELITQVKRRGQIPTSQNTWDTEAILDTATEELHGFVMPLMKKVREEYFVSSSDTTLSASTTTVPINARAVGMALREVERVTASGGIESLPYLDPDQKQRETNGGYYSLSYYLQWNNIVLAGDDLTGTLRQYFYIRPGSLIATTDAGKITAIDTGTYTVTLDVSTNPFAASDVCDFIRGDGAHEYRGIDYTVASVSGSDVTFSSLPDGLAVNDWLSPAEKSPIPQLPRDLQPLLVQATLVTILDAMGDPRVEIARRKLEDPQRGMIKSALDMITPRNHGEAKKIVSGYTQRRWWSI